jgi:hypothetical protein
VCVLEEYAEKGTARAKGVWRSVIAAAVPAALRPPVPDASTVRASTLVLGTAVRGTNVTAEAPRDVGGAPRAVMGFLGAGEPIKSSRLGDFATRGRVAGMAKATRSSCSSSLMTW